jgi:hypothetical protein
MRQTWPDEKKGPGTVKYLCNQNKKPKVDRALQHVLGATARKVYPRDTLRKVTG